MTDGEQLHYHGNTSDFKSTDQMQMSACTDFEQAKQCGGVKPVKELQLQYILN